MCGKTVSSKQGDIRAGQEREDNSYFDSRFTIFFVSRQIKSYGIKNRIR